MSLSSLLGKAISVLRREGLAPLLLRGVVKVLGAAHGRLYATLARMVEARQAALPAGEPCPAGEEPLPSRPAEPPVEVEALPAPEPSRAREIVFRTSDAPEISIVVAVPRDGETALRCFRSLATDLKERAAAEVIVVERAGSGRVGRLRAGLAGARIVAGTLNAGAHVARSGILCFLAGHVEVTPGWLQGLVRPFHSDPGTGITGAMLLRPDGRVHQAGGIVWRDGGTGNYGWLDSAEEPEYNYAREVDFCSAGCLAIRREVFDRLGGFSPDFGDGCLCDADLCFGARHLGYRVVYCPESRVIDHSEESPPAGHEAAREAFRSKWEPELARCFERDPLLVPRACRRLRGGRAVLIIDDDLPFHDRDAGSHRMMHLVRILRELGHPAIFLPHSGRLVEPYASELQRMGVEVLYRTAKQPSLNQQVRERLALVDFAWISRPHLFGEYYPVIRCEPRVRIVYDTIDLHHVRLKRQGELVRRQGGVPDDSWRTYRHLEIAYSRLADATVTVTGAEREILNRYGARAVYVVPTIHEPYPGALKPFDEREGILFLGGYAHPPNVDAVLWLCGEIMPLVWASRPDIRVTLAGYNPPPEVRALAAERVAVTGYVPDVEPYFLGSRVFAAPLRFGAGMNGKIGQSLSYGLPTVTTPVGAEGLGLADGVQALIARDSNAFAAGILRLYEDAELWRRISRAALEHVRRFQPSAVRDTVRGLLEDL